MTEDMSKQSGGGSFTNKSKVIIPLILLTLVLVIGTSFALWQITLKQTDENRLTIGCFAISFSDKNAIDIGNAYPLTEAEGKELIPYEFTIDNTCEKEASYQINLEILQTTTLEKYEHIRVLLEESSETNSSSLLSEYETTQKTLEEASSSYKLSTGTIESKQQKTYYLRIWLDENTPASNEIMNRIFNTKVTITTALGEGGTNPTPGPGEDDNPSGSISKEVLAYIKNNATEGEIVEDDETVDHNLRYIGANPNNYVRFNNELWRIIGVMNNMKTNEEDSGEARIKIVRNESIGEYSWDGLYDNNSDWARSSVMKLLNPGYETESVGGSLYWNKSKGLCYYRQYSKTTACDFSTTGLQDTASISMIADTIWNLGGFDVKNVSKLASSFYEKERSSDVKEGNPTTWKGKIGLIYPSDYGYSTSGSETTMRVTCLSNSMSDWSSGSGLNDCSTNSWINSISPRDPKWTMTTLINTSDMKVYTVSIGGTLYFSAHYSGIDIHPSLYLKSNVKIVSGVGSQENPFELELVE